MTAHKSGQKWIRFMKIPPYRYITYLMLVQITMISYIIKFLFHIICWKEPLWYLRKAFILYKLDRELFWCFKLHNEQNWIHTPWRIIGTTMQIAIYMFKNKTIPKSISYFFFLFIYFFVILFKVLFPPKINMVLLFQTSSNVKKFFLENIIVSFVLNSLKVQNMLWRILWRKLDSIIDTRILFNQFLKIYPLEFQVKEVQVDVHLMYNNIHSYTNFYWNWIFVLSYIWQNILCMLHEPWLWKLWDFGIMI